MKRLYLQSLETDRDYLIEPGEFILGRDCILQCEDNRISRNHGIIKYERTDEIVKIKSTHFNPIYYKKSGNESVNILKENDEGEVSLQSGEKFALLPDKYWYSIHFKDQEIAHSSGSSSTTNGCILDIRVRNVSEINASNVDAPSPEVNMSLEIEVPIVENGVIASDEEVRLDLNNSIDRKRKTPTENIDTPDKKPKISEPTEHSTNSSAVNDTTEDVKPNIAELEEPPMPLPKIEPVDENDMPSTSSGVRRNVTVKHEPGTNDNTNDEKPARPVRDSCQFGIKCYRRNEDHRAEFAHPKDPDYRRPSFPPGIVADPSAPMCQFGSSCYRRNPEHFRLFNHPDPNVEPESSSTESSFDDNNDDDDYGYDDFNSSEDSDFSLSYASTIDDSDMDGVELYEGGEMEE